MKNVREYRRKSFKNKSRDHAGYILGRNLRRNINRQVRQLGETLNSGQHRLGIRTTGVILAFIWTIALCYFVSLLLTIF